MKLSLPLKIIVCVVVCLGLGSASGLLAGSATTEWYNRLVKPSFQPPPWVFGPAWSLLYTLMGIALARVWNAVDSTSKSRALVIFGVQFVLNLLWSPVFFGMENPKAALVIIVLMWIFIVATIRAFGKTDKTAAYLLIPYLLWVSFASLLNAAIVYLN